MTPMEQDGGAIRLLIGLATYNEAESLPVIIARIRGEFPDAHIVVVDDGSPDGTGHWCDKQAASDSEFQCVHRSGKQGLGSATAVIFQRAIDDPYDWLATMDADGSHDPDELKSLIAAARQGNADVVIGSRYVKGGRVEGWPWPRRIASRCVNALARLWLRLPTRDNSGAFRLYKIASLRQIDAANLSCRGYGYLEEILYRLNRQGRRLQEVPITFRQRMSGRSKLNWRECFRTIVELLSLPWRVGPR